MSRQRIKVKGVVQGVGFRPFVYNLARRLNLRGFVKNTSKGVVIEVEGDGTEQFLSTLRESPPPLARIEDIQVEELQEIGYPDFQILESEEEGSFTHVSPDVSVCEDCLRELMDPSDRRYLYPFINCTNCGPRYTITRGLPYDRPNTTMAEFEMCKVCAEEYHDPTNRRFHAQPNACPECGPHLYLKVNSSRFAMYEERDPLEACISILREGGIVAVKGLGGFHIACDAENREVVSILRQRKKRGNKPFALMAPDIETIEQYCHISDEERRLLLSKERPIVLLRRRGRLLEWVAPQNPFLGFMLPYTPLHHLLFYYPAGRAPNFKALVMTSGNLSEEPIVHREDDALSRLSGIVDAFLFHNRDIYMRVDDSVLSAELVIRRARGYVPNSVKLKIHTPEALATGGDLKNTFTLTKEGYAIVSQHIGDMENYETLQFFEEVVENLCRLYRVTPRIIATDMHPQYHSRLWAERQGLPVIYWQHHHAHVASVLAEADLNGPVIGVVLDGTGYGTDGRLWGFEVLLVEGCRFERLAHLRYIPLPGGEAAIREPWRVAIALIKETFSSETDRWIERLGLAERVTPVRVEMIQRLLQMGGFTVMSSGCGRLFDGVASLLAVKDVNTFEAEAPIALESTVTDGIDRFYRFELTDSVPSEIDYRPTVEDLVREYAGGRPVQEIATRFHNTVVEATVMSVKRISRQTGIRDVVLSGGVFQNHYLLRRMKRRLKEEGLQCFTHREFPPNDASVSLGQAFLTALHTEANNGY